MFVFQFALLVLTAYGADRLLAREDEQQAGFDWLKYVQRALLGFGVLAWILFLHRFLELTIVSKEANRVMIASLVAFALAALLQAVRRGGVGPTAMRLGLLGLLVFELGVAHSLVLMHRTDPEPPKFLAKLDAFEGVVEFLKSQPRPFRFEVHREGPTVNIGAWEGLEMVDGSLASVSRDLLDFVGEDWAGRRLMLNMVYTVAKQKVRESQVEVFSDSSGWKVFRNPDAYPRAWAVHDTSVIRDDSGAPVPPPEPCEGQATVDFEQPNLHWVRARARMPCSGFLVFADPYFPGWQAKVNGESATLYRAHSALRAVFVPAGEHSVEFAYRPTSVYVGGVLTALGLFACALLAVVTLRREKTTSS